MEENNGRIDKPIKQIISIERKLQKLHEENQRLFQETQKLREEYQRLFQENQTIFQRLESYIKGNINIHQNLNINEILNKLDEVELNDQFKNKDEDKCVICLEVFSIGDKVSYLPCFHYFHSFCIKNWIRIKNKCPFCNNIFKFS